MKLKTLGLLAGFLAAPSIALAQETEVAMAVPTDSVFIFNTMLFLLGGVLVFWMHAGFAMLEAGLVRSKNVTMQLTKNIGLFTMSLFAYFILGYNVMYPLGDWAMDGVLSALWFPAVLEPVAPAMEALDDYSYAATGSDFFFQIMFCGATASIVSGAVAERIRLWPFLAFVFFLTGIFYPLMGSWKWGGGFLDEMGFLDFAGSTLVHSVGGWAALTGVIILGPRIGKYKDGKVVPVLGNNLPLAALGTFILWMGWFGFNGASQLAIGSISDAADVARIFANTNAAAAGGGLAALAMTALLYKNADLTMALNGCLGGLVAITAEPLFPSLGLSTIIGAIGGTIVVLGVPLLDRLKVDDVVGAVPVHLMAGIFGTVVVPLSNPDGSFIVQIYGVVVYAIASIILTTIAWLAIKAIFGIRVSEEAEIEGLDVHELGMEAYDIQNRA